MHRQRVHDPGHGLAIGVHVRRGDVAVVADENRDLGCESPSQVLELVGRQLIRVDDDPALGAAERDVDHGALPRHPHRERLDLVEGHVRVVPDASFGRAAVDVVLHAVAREHPNVPVVELHRERAGELALDLAEHLAEPRLELDQLGGLVELGLRGAPLVGLDHRFQLSGAHRGPYPGSPRNRRFRGVGIIARFFGVFTSVRMIADIPLPGRR